MRGLWILSFKQLAENEVTIEQVKNDFEEALIQNYCALIQLLLRPNVEAARENLRWSPAIAQLIPAGGQRIQRSLHCARFARR